MLILLEYNIYWIFRITKRQDIKRKITSQHALTYCQDLLDMVCIFLWVYVDLWRDKLLLSFLSLNGTEVGEEEYWGLVQCEISV